jgi:hypothetical protein
MLVRNRPLLHQTFIIGFIAAYRLKFSTNNRAAGLAPMFCHTLPSNKENDP